MGFLDFLRELFDSGGDFYAPPGYQADMSDPKAPVVQKVLRAVANQTATDMSRTEIGWIKGDPDHILTLLADIEQFEYIREKRGFWRWQGVFEEQQIERRWARRPREVRRLEGIERTVSIAIPTAFGADPKLSIVRFWFGDLDVDPRTYRVSVEAVRGAMNYDWRYEKKNRGYLSPIVPHGNEPLAASATTFSPDPTDFEFQVAEALRNLGLKVDVTGGVGDEGVDIVAFDPSPIQGGKYIVQCKRYDPSNKVGVQEVRELYGVVQAKGVNKGILVTSSSFTSGALRFAEGKPLELIDGKALRSLIGEVSADTRSQAEGMEAIVPFHFLYRENGWEVECHSYSLFKNPFTGETVLVLRGHITNSLSRPQVAPIIKTTLKDESGFNFSVEGTSPWDIVINSKEDAGFQARFLPGEYTMDWRIESIYLESQADNRDGVPEIYEDITIKILNQEAESVSTETIWNMRLLFEITNTGLRAPTCIHLLYQLVDNSSRFLGTLGFSLFSDEKHGEIKPGETAMFEVELTGMIVTNVIGCDRLEGQGGLQLKATAFHSKAVDLEEFIENRYLIGGYPDSITDAVELVRVY